MRTRNRILELILDEPRTVKELAEDLELTTNAVRQQLVNLERQGLVIQEGEKRTAGRPAHVYRPTLEAVEDFPSYYRQGLVALVPHMLDLAPTPNVVQDLFRDAGRDVGARDQLMPGADSGDERLLHAVYLLEDAGARPAWDLADATLRLTVAPGLLPAVARDHPGLALWFACGFVEGILDAELEHARVELPADGEDRGTIRGVVPTGIAEAWDHPAAEAEPVAGADAL